MIAYWMRAAQEADTPPPTGRRRGRMTLIQIKALRDLKKGSIRIRRPGVLALCPGVHECARPLRRTRFRPGGLKAFKNAALILLEIARQRYRFDLLFVEDVNRQRERVEVLCPHCQRYWSWRDSLPNDLRKPSGRLCEHCRPDPKPGLKLS
jgi:hypothetical protein